MGQQLDLSRSSLYPSPRPEPPEEVYGIHWINTFDKKMKKALMTTGWISILVTIKIIIVMAAQEDVAEDQSTFIACSYETQTIDLTCINREIHNYS